MSDSSFQSKIGAATRLAWEGFLDLLYPPHCLLCGLRLPEGALCGACLCDTHPPTPPFCERCGVPVAMGRLVCPLCEQGLVPSFDWSHAMGAYAGDLRRAILLLKYHEKPALAEPLGVLLAQSLDTMPSSLFASGNPFFDCVVPTPLHPKRLWQRGYNQAERLARAVARERGWRLETEGLLRTRSTRPQASLQGDARRTNIIGAFGCRSADAFAGLSVLLIDDVLTTNSTASECAKALKNGGAKRVFVAALARGA